LLDRLLDTVRGNSKTRRAAEERDKFDIVAQLAQSAPNLILNVKQTVSPAWESWLCASLGVILQVATLILAGFATYHWRWSKGGKTIASYGFPCFLAGTAAVSVGLLICAHVIEASTDECKFDIYLSEVNVIRIQRACSVSEQNFKSFALVNEGGDRYLRTSRLNKKDYGRWAAFGSAVAIVGFIAQFVGLRALHWSATIMQLGVTLIMTGVRSYVRRGLARGIKAIPIPDGDELSWLVEHITGTEGVEILAGAYLPPDDGQGHLIKWEDMNYSMPGQKISEEEPHDLIQGLKSILGYGRLPEGWEQLTAPNGRAYYTNHNNRTTTFAKPERIIPEPRGSSLVLSIIQLRKYLSALVPWDSHEANVATRLYSAMRKVDTILRDASFVESSLHEGSITEWSMDALLHEDIQTVLARPTFEFNPSSEAEPRNHRGRSASDTEAEFQVVLSMWLKVLRLRGRDRNWAMSAPVNFPSEHNPERLVVEPQFIRVLDMKKSTQGLREAESQVLRKWMSKPIFRIPIPFGDSQLNVLGHEELLSDDMSSVSPSELHHHHPVFGFNSAKSEL
jgi:hypothetical protein